MKKPELLAPAGDLERLKIALEYGADAVYFGGEMFGLRANAINFTIDQIKEATTYAHERNKKVYVTVNIVLHNKETENILEYLKKEHKKARHIPYAYKIDNLVKKSDDKEPSGTAGLPILNIIDKNNMDNTLIVVIRYFGGIKLGAGGLIRAYSNAARDVIKID